MKNNSAQNGIGQMVLVLVIAVGLIGYIVLSSSAEFKNSLFADLYSKKASFAAGPTKNTFSNLSSDLKANSATFNFSYTGSNSLYIVDVSTDSKMRSDVLSSFGTGTSSPIVVQSPQSLWSKYQCGATIYWKISATVLKGYPSKSSIQKGAVDCSVTAIPATLSVTSTPSGATVNNIDTGYVYCTTTPCTVQVAVPPNSVNLRVSKDGYTSWTNLIYLYSGQTTNVTATLPAM